jgi:hypothetical protein
MNQTIRITAAPDGAGPLKQLNAFIGCQFRLAGPEVISLVHAEYPHLDDLPPAYEVTLEDVCIGLETNGQAGWAAHYRSLAHPPKLFRFSPECAEVITG